MHSLTFTQVDRKADRCEWDQISTEIDEEVKYRCKNRQTSKNIAEKIEDCRILSKADLFSREGGGGRRGRGRESAYKGKDRQGRKNSCKNRQKILNTAKNDEKDRILS